MNKELFGVFGDRNRFERLHHPGPFHRVVEGGSVTVGLRDAAIGIPNRTQVATDGDDLCVTWGEVYPPDGVREPAASWLLDRVASSGLDALSALNGSYLAVVEHDGRVLVATDQIRSRECFYADTHVGRAFGTDPLAVVRTVPAPTVRRRALLELLHLSVVTGDRTLVRELNRAPFDGYLERDGTGVLDRFVYDPGSFDYAAELAERLQRAMDRRATLPGRKGLLLSGGYDSRAVLAGLRGLDRAYTIGEPDGDVVRTAERVAKQYGVPHETLPIDERYLPLDPQTIRYGQGIKESLQIHHAGYAAALDVDTIYHALLFDTLFRGHFLPRADVDVLGHTLPRTRLDPDPDIVETVLARYGILPQSESLFPACDVVDAETHAAFVESVVEDRLDAWSDRYDSVYNAIELFGIENQPTTPFRTHLDDTHLESFVTADAELVDWHLTTPPEHRNTKTFLAAATRIDSAILRHPPHDRPHRSTTANEVERFVRRLLPFVEAFDPAWPNHDRLYRRRDLDRRLFPGHPELHHLPSRLKLRINDITSWLELGVDGLDPEPTDVLCPGALAAPTHAPTRAEAAVVPSNE